MKAHRYAECFPVLPDDAPEFRALVEDIRAHGLLSPVLTYAGKILDGRHRERACKVAGVAPHYREFDGDASAAHAIVWSANACRRDLTAMQRAAIRKLWQDSDPEAKARLKAREAEATDRVRAGTSDGAGGRGRKKNPGSNCSQGFRAPRAKDLEAKEAGSTRRCIELAVKLPFEDLNAAARGDLTEAEIRKRARLAKRAERDRALVEKNSALPSGERRYGVIYADPPWQYEHPISTSREIEEKYPTMGIEDICAMDVAGAVAADDCVLFLWVPPSLVRHGLRVVDAWGFDYRTMIIWDKERIGPGYWVRQQAELLLVGIRGAPATPAECNRPASVFRAKRGKHSEKPAAMYGVIERMYPGVAAVELFARVARDGWDRWGNQS